MFFSKINIPSTYYLIDSFKKLAWLAREVTRAEVFAFDIETNHPTWKKKTTPPGFTHRLGGISYAWGHQPLSGEWRPGIAAYVPMLRSNETPYWGDRQDAVVEVLSEIQESPVPKVAHNGKFDVGRLMELSGIRTQKLVFDTMLAHALLDEDRVVSTHALKSKLSKTGGVISMGVADAYLNIGESGASLWKGDLDAALSFYDSSLQRYTKVPLQTLYPYGCADSDLTLSLMYVFKEMLAREGLTWLFENITMPLQHVLMIMELHGFPLDIHRAKVVQAEQAAIMSKATKDAQTIVGREFKVSSPTELGRVLFEEMGLPGRKTPLGEWITDADALVALNHPISDPLAKYRRAQQIYGTYVTAALDRVHEVTHDGTIGWVHSECLMDSVTGRLKFTKPNLTTLPRPENGGLTVKSTWVAPEGYKIIFKDFSQVELRVIAHISQEPVWIEGFNAGLDMHAAMAKKVFNLPCTVDEVKTHYYKYRSDAKGINFGIAYGESPYALAQRLGISVEEATHLIEVEYFGAVPVLKAAIEETHRQAIEEGYVTNIFGRRRHLPGAGIHVPQSAFWPNIRPKCYRKGPYAKKLGIDFSEIPEMDSSMLAGLVRTREGDWPEECADCSCLYSCIINREVKHAKSIRQRALRQSFNFRVQGSAVDMASQALIWINEEIRKYQLPACPILHIHDELVVYAHDSVVEHVCAIMDDCMMRRLHEFTNFSVPLLIDTDIVSRWSDKHGKSLEEIIAEGG